MIRLYSLDALNQLENRAPSCLLVGVFDGVHRGHARLLERARDRLREWRKKAGGRAGSPPGQIAVLTFQNHPRSVLQPDQAPRMLSSLDRRLDGLEALGANLAVAVRFDRKFSSLAPEDFLRGVVAEGFRTRHLICGPDLRFGRKGTGTIDLVRRMAPELGLEVETVEPVYFEGEPVSSSRIRRLVREGEMRHAATLLGHPYELEGEVVTGHQRGRLIGYPTANLRLETWIEQPLTGVYAVEAELCATADRIPAMMNLGYSPTFGDIEEVRAEVHLFDFQGELTGQRMRVRVLERLRPEQRFAALEDLVRQLHEDEGKARQMLGLRPARAGNKARGL